MPGVQGDDAGGLCFTVGGGRSGVVSVLVVAGTGGQQGEGRNADSAAEKGATGDGSAHEPRLVAGLENR